MYYIFFKDLPANIKEKAEINYTDHLNKWHPRKKKMRFEDRTLGNCFAWSSTNESEFFWREINKGNFATFYERYPKRVDNYSIV